MAYPTSLDTFVDPEDGDTLANAGGLTHAEHHVALNDAVEALEAKVGVTGSAVTTSHDYKFSRTCSVDNAMTGALQNVEVGGVASALQVSTTGVYVGGDLTTNGGVIVGGTLEVIGEFTLASGTIGYVSIGGNFEVDGAGNIGFFGAAPVGLPTVSGSTESNAALESLLTALADLGLIQNLTEP
jgi:hypothetical protein